MISFVTISDALREDFYKLMAEYLPGSSFERVSEEELRWPKAFIACVEDSRVIGVAYGWLRADGVSFCLDGIAIEAAHWRQGLGRKLLSVWEQAVREYGAHFVSVGSADGYVEDFYIACGYSPMCYKIYAESGIEEIKQFADEADYRQYKRPQESEGFVVMEKFL